MDEDRDLLRRWRAGENAAGELFFSRHVPTVYRFFRNKIERDVEDFVHQTFERCFAGADRLEQLQSVRAYLLGIARNILLMYLRRLGRARNVFDDFGRASAAALSGQALAFAAGKEEQRLLLLALRQIPVEMQIAVELFYWEDLSLAEIAAVCDIPVGTVKSRLARAKGLLRDAMQESEAPAALIKSTTGALDKWATGLRDKVNRS